MDKIYLTGVLASFLLYVLVGNYAGRRVENVEDYYVSGRNAPTILILGTLVASAMSTVSFMGDAGWAYGGAFIVDMGTGMVQSYGFLAGALIFGRFLRRSEVLTSAEYFKKRFDSAVIQKLIAVIVVVAIGGYLVSVTKGVALMFSMLLNGNYVLALLIVWGVYTSFTFYAGSKGVLLTDTIMFVLFFCIAVVCAPVIIENVGGWSHVMETLTSSDIKEGILSFGGVPGSYRSDFEAFAWMMATGLTWGICFAVSPWQAGRYMMARDEHVIMRVGSIAAIFSVLIMLTVTMSAVSVNVVNSSIDPPEQVLVWAALNLMPEWLGILLLSGIAAAGLSTCSTFLQIIGNTFTRDIINVTKTDEAHAKGTLKISRLVMLVFGILSLVLTYFQPSAVLTIAIFAGTLIAASLGAVSFASVWSKRLTKLGALLGILGGFVGSLAVNFLENIVGMNIPAYFGPFYVGTLLSIIGLIVGSLLSKVTDEEREYREFLHREPAGLRDHGQLAKTLKYPIFAVVLGVVVMIFMIVCYSIPYNDLIA